MKAQPRVGDVVLSRRCNPGETAHVPDGIEFALGQNLVLLRAKGDRVHPPFLRWLVCGPEWWRQISKFLNVGAVFDSLRCADVPKFELSIPPLPEQRAIAHILGTLDDKIELNRRMTETLEAMARALFKSWFVDFDPVRAKAEGRNPGLGLRGRRVEPESREERLIELLPANRTSALTIALTIGDGVRRIGAEPASADGGRSVGRTGRADHVRYLVIGRRRLHSRKLLHRPVESAASGVTGFYLTRITVRRNALASSSPPPRQWLARSKGIQTRCCRRCRQERSPRSG